MFLYHPRADPGVNLNFKQYRAFPWVHPTCQHMVVNQDNYFSYFKMPGTQRRLPWQMKTVLVLNFILISLRLSLTGILLCYSQKWWQMPHTPYKEEEPECVRTSEIYSGKSLAGNKMKLRIIHLHSYAFWVIKSTKSNSR